MKKYYKCFEKHIGLSILCIGIGVITVVIVPFWWWVIAVGGGVIYLGWSIMDNNHHC